MGLDHVGIVVPNAQEAADFLIDVFDAEFDWEVKREPEPKFGERGWDKLFGVHRETYMPHVIMLKCGDAPLTQYVELFEFVSPDQSEVPRKGEGGWLRFSDITNSYISFTVKDLDAVMAHIKNEVVPKWDGVRFIQDPPMEFPLRGEVCRSTFIVSPWGQWVELTEWSEGRHSVPVLKKLRGDVRYDHPCVGQPVEALETPCYMVDLDAFEHNAGLMRERFAAHGVAWRPTCKGHKSPTLARKLTEEFGAQGVLVLTVEEAEKFAQEGHDDIHVANQVVSATKVEKLSLLAKCVRRLKVNVDDAANIRQLSDAVAQWEIATPLELMVEINIGHNRCGVSPAEAVPLVQLVKELEAHGTVRFGGLAGYEGHTPVLPPEEKTAETRRAHGVLAEAKRLVEEAGISVDVVTG
eukprot:CAMPEP_0119151140 /NCGR_PEP_ID=MMETSP1310-20130426/45919_1 /TAXON_ID=464262 /ORGANISM="Genus nov. species nov., Strain RCC2339" /LENGTH=408 /DNA_ID=CAMNT_0007143391 /DNA_START=199 /DNA_END=1421 /DNA_ORIENTATION=+